MYVKNLLNPISEQSLLYGDKMLGLVVKNPEDMEKDNVIGAYIPKLFFGIPVDKGAFEKKISIDSSKLLNSVNKNIGAKNCTFKNWVTVQVAQCCNTLTPKYARGENVFIDCCDHDLKNLYVLPWTLGEVQKRKDDIWKVLCPNLSEYSNAKLNLDNTFGIEINTKSKILSLWTGKTDGKESSKEKGTYYIGINAKEGNILISDSGKRTITINSDEDQIIMLNEAETQIDLTKDTINMKAKHLNIDIKDDIKVTSKKMKRDIKEINTKCSKDTEETDELKIKGNNLTSNYNDTKVESSSYTNKTSKWKTDSPISGFTKVLTSDSFSIWPNAGVNPMPMCANISNSGIFTSAYPCTPSMALAKAQPLMTVLSAIAAKLDIVGAIAFCPPTSVAAVAAAAPMIPSKSSLG